MKKLLLAVFMLSATTAAVTLTPQMVYAKSGGTHTSIPAKLVPTAVKKNFKAMFPDAGKTQWETSTVYYGGITYSASFYRGSQKWEATFYADGTFITAGPKL